MEWNFDDQTAKYTYEDTWDNYQNDRRFGPCATSLTGKLFLYSGDLDSKNNSVLQYSRATLGIFSNHFCSALTQKLETQEYGRLRQKERKPHNGLCLVFHTSL